MNPNELTLKQKEIEGKRVRDWRERLGLSRVELAAAANVSVSIIEKMEVGLGGSRAMVDHLHDTLIDVMRARNRKRRA